MMIKPMNLVKGDKVAIVSLSRGLLGLPGCKHEIDIATKRLEEYGLEVVMMPNTLAPMDYLKEHPEARAADLKQAFLDDEIKGIICAIGGDDTYRLIPYLMEDEEFVNAVRNSPKIFTGFSDTTMNHLMLNKLGLMTYYGPCLMVDIAELDDEMLPYTKTYFEKFFENEEEFEIEISDVWYSDRESYSAEYVGVPRKVHPEVHGYEVLNGSGIVEGKLYGGCIESIYDAMTGTTYADEKDVIAKYNILPTLEEWEDRILFLETSELMATPEELKKMLMEFKDRGIFNRVRGLIIGKPIDEKYYEDYKNVYREVFSDLDTPILYNMNFGHAVPRCILPYGATCVVDYDKKTVRVSEPMLEKNSVNEDRKVK